MNRPQALAQAQNGEKPVPVNMPEVRVEYLGAEKGYTVAGASVSLLCVVRNIGAIPLPENAVRLRCLTLSGLEYTSGELWPIVPALAPHQAATVRWRLAPKDNNSPLIVSVLIDRLQPTPSAAVLPANSDAGGPSAPKTAPPASEAMIPGASRAVLAIIPRFGTMPRLTGSGAGSDGAPQAGAAENSAWVGNDRIVLRFQKAHGSMPVLALAAKDGTQWNMLATGTPLAQIRSGEEGQTSWWEMFRWRDSQTRADKDTATLTLMGTVGANWQAEIVLESKRNTGAINGKLRLTAKRTLRCFGVQLPRLLAETDEQNPVPKADGSMQMLEPDTSPLAETDRAAAEHRGAITFGLTWPSNAPLNGWNAARLPVGDHAYAPILGAQWDSPERGEVILAGATLEFSFRLFAFAPSDSVRDALRFIPQ